MQRYLFTASDNSILIGTYFQIHVNFKFGGLLSQRGRFFALYSSSQQPRGSETTVEGVKPQGPESSGAPALPGTHGPAEGDMTLQDTSAHPRPCRAALEVVTQGAAVSGRSAGAPQGAPQGAPAKQGLRTGRSAQGAGEQRRGRGAMLGCSGSRREGEGKGGERGRRQDSRGGRQGNIKASDTHLSRHRARGRESWSGSSSSSRSPGGEPAAGKHARTVAGESAELPLPALGPLEERDGARYPAPSEGRQLKRFAAPPPPRPPPPLPLPSRGTEEEEEGAVRGGHQRSVPLLPRGAGSRPVEWWEPAGVAVRPRSLPPPPPRDGTGPIGAGGPGRRLDGTS